MQLTKKEFLDLLSAIGDARRHYVEWQEEIDRDGIDIDAVEICEEKISTYTALLNKLSQLDNGFCNAVYRFEVQETLQSDN